MKIVSSFMERIGMLLEQNPGSLTKVASELGVSRQTIGAWKSGERSPKRPTIEAICLYFRVSPAWLCGYDVPMRLVDESKEISSIKKEALELIDTLGDDQLRVLLDVARSIYRERDK